MLSDSVLTMADIDNIAETVDTISRDQALAMIDATETFESEGLTQCVATLKNGWTVIGIEYADGAREAAYEALVNKLINQGAFFAKQAPAPAPRDRKQVADRLMAARVAGVIKPREVEPAPVEMPIEPALKLR